MSELVKFFCQNSLKNYISHQNCLLGHGLVSADKFDSHGKFRVLYSKNVWELMMLLK